MPDKKTQTLNTGAPMADNDHSLTAGERGPVLLQDYFYIEKIAHFDRERIAERVVHAKGAGAFGYFEASKDMSAYTRAHLFGQVGRKTPMLARFSTVGGEKGSADAERDPRGFALRFYTEEGNYDIVGNNTPVFFIRDPLKFPDLIHTHKRNPVSNLKDPDAFWDFHSLTPESTHQLTILFSDRGIPKNFRHMHGFGSHTFRWVNADGKAVFVKYHFRSEAGIENLKGEDAAILAGQDPDHATRDLHEHIASGKQAAWQVEVQIMPEKDAETYRFDPFDVTQVWLHKDYPRLPIGRMVLDRNPENFFAQIEQAAFSPSNFVPGVEASPDKILQGRLFSYPDTQRHRLGANYQQIPVNCPYAARAKVNNYQRDGQMRVDGNFGGASNYAPNTREGPVADPSAKESDYALVGTPIRAEYPKAGRADDYEQAGMLFRMMPKDAQQRLCTAIAQKLCMARKEVQARQLVHFQRADPAYGAGVEAALTSQ